jgi:hypothetical protein
MGVQPITIPQSLAYVLNNAGDKSDVDFNYLLQTAQRESALNPTAKAPSSSAVGLFQFLDSTWLQVMKEEGPRLGYQKYADAITQDGDGDYVIKDKKLRTEVLKLREDPQIAADMAAAFTRSNGAYLQGKFGRMPSPGELYIAHFLGPQGAEKMFNAGLDDPDQVAARIFPRQAKANPRIFYADGHARTVREVYKALVAQHDGIVAADVAPDPKFAAQQMTTDPAGKWTTDNVPSRFTKADMSFNALFATEKPTGVPQPLVDTRATTPLIGAEAAAPLMQSQGLQMPLALMPRGQTSSLDLTGGPEPLKAIDDAMSGPSEQSDDASALGFSPLPAPTPLLPPGVQPATAFPSVTTDAMPAVAPDIAPPVSDIPRPRVLMSNPALASAFVTQLYTRR